MYLTLIILPLLGSVASGFLGRKIGVVGSHVITCTCVIITTILSFIAFMEVGFNNTPVEIHLFRWVDSESLYVLWGFNFDSLTVSMLIPVLVVSSLVHLYSIEYMSHDPHNQRFFSYLSLFTFMMIILVTANNFLLMFVGWEGVGVCSYLLVSFWFTRIAANQSSMSAFLTNRVGDCFLTVGMFAILWSFGNIDYSTVFSIAPFINEDIITIIGICLLIGAMAKSSQVGLHIWLPMAMEGPTPVSALIHAATMVTAGVYLLMRCSPLLEYSSTVLISCLWLGAITTVFSSLIGLFQQDIKKVIAYSTMSQLGMMVIAIGLSSYNVALFHLVNHAFYKALLFLGAGAVIHAVSDNQDFRKYGGLRQLLPLTYSVMLIASLSLVAFPFMTGFYSKDFILESAYGQFTFSGITVYLIATIGAMFTTLYSVKVLYITFIGNPLGPIGNYEKAHEGGLFMSLPLIILAIFSIFFGYITKDIFIGLGTSFFMDNSIFIHPNNEIMLDTEFAVPTVYKLLPLFFTIFFTLISLILSEIVPNLLLTFKFSKLGYNIFGFFNQRFLIELFYNKFITNLVFKLGGQTTKVLDKGSVENLGPYGLEKVMLNLSINISRLDTMTVTTYALYILIGLLSYLLIVYTGLFNTNIFIILILSIFVTINNKVLVPHNIYNNLPRPYNFVTTPLQSGLGNRLFNKLFNLNVLIKIVTIFFFIIFVKWFMTTIFVYIGLDFGWLITLISVSSGIYASLIGEEIFSSLKILLQGDKALMEGSIESSTKSPTELKSWKDFIIKSVNQPESGPESGSGTAPDSATDPYRGSAPESDSDTHSNAESNTNSVFEDNDQFNRANNENTQAYNHDVEENDSDSANDAALRAEAHRLDVTGKDSNGLAEDLINVLYTIDNMPPGSEEAIKALRELESEVRQAMRNHESIAQDNGFGNETWDPETDPRVIGHKHNSTFETEYNAELHGRISEIVDKNNDSSNSTENNPANENNSTSDNNSTSQDNSTSDRKRKRDNN